MTEWLIDTVIVTSALMTLVLLTRNLVARSFGPGVTYALWLLPALRLFMPPLAIGKIAFIAADANAPVAQSIEIPVSDALVSQNVAIESTTWMEGYWLQMVIILWLGVGAVLVVMHLIRYKILRDALLSNAVVVGEIGNIRLIRTDRIEGPLAFGLLRRFVALPANFDNKFEAEERELALAHEIAHHRAGDLFANFAAMLILSLNWFNPLAWVSWRAFRIDQEAACDARVIAGLEAGQKQIYGRTLAKSASGGTPVFATALNSPKTLFERLRRLSMDEVPGKRRAIGKIGLVLATLAILPLSATITPAAEPQAQPAKVTEEHIKMVKIFKDKDGNMVDTADSENGTNVVKIMRNGKSYEFHTNKQLSHDEIEKLIAEAYASKADDETAKVDGETARADTETARADSKASANDSNHVRKIIINTHGDGEANGAESDVQAFVWKSGDQPDAAAFIPEIDISELSENCKQGEPVTSNITGSDGKKRTSIKIVVCGKGQGKVARAEAIKGLREARNEITSEKDIPENIRKSVLESLEKQIENLEKQTTGE